MNALNQAREFNKAVPLTGLVVTKLDGTSKGGMVVAIQKELGLPIKFVGLGEQAEDLQPFDPKQFAEALFESA
jgi:fused signal recognition particle receptor